MIEKEKLYKTHPIRMFKEVKFVKHYIHRLRPNFEIGSLVGRYL